LLAIIDALGSNVSHIATMIVLQQSSGNS